MLIFGPKKGSSNPRYVEEHRNTDLNKCLNNTIFLLLDGRDIFRIESTCIEGINEAMDEDDKKDGHSSDPICIIHSLLLCWLLLLLFWLMLQSVHILPCSTVEH